MVHRGAYSKRTGYKVKYTIFPICGRGGGGGEGGSIQRAIFMGFILGGLWAQVTPGKVVKLNALK